jgi:pimeloyl-ACP methyl ester carboxylesterase
VKRWAFILTGGALMLMITSSFGCSSPEPVSQEVTWEIGQTRVYANLTSPASAGPHPAVLFIAGSGPTDRDWNSPLLPGTNGSARLLADALVRDGFVTLRYDKRVSGEHLMENIPYLVGNISMQSHLDEVIGAVELLAARSEVDSSRIFVLTSSEGAIHALNYQRQAAGTKFHGLVLTGPPGRPMSEVVRTQMVALFATYPNPDELMALFDEAVADFVAGRPVEPDPALPDAARFLLGSLSTPVNQPFARELWDTDIAPWLKEVSQPVLVLIGKKDIQVDWELDGAPLEAAAGKENVTFVYPEDANHVLKYEEKPREELGPGDSATYNLDDRVLDPVTLATIRSWLDEHR